MKLCKTCMPIVGETIASTSKVKPVITLDNEDCDNCGFSHDDMKSAEYERLRATNVETLEDFIDEQFEKTKKYIKF
jgi:hypothetical protein